MPSLPHESAIAPIETALRAAELPFHRRAKLFRPPRNRDLIAYLKTFINPHDDISLLASRTPRRADWSDVTMERLFSASHERKESVFAAMKTRQ